MATTSARCSPGTSGAPATGLYRFWLTSADASRLRIAGHDVLENDGWHKELTVSDVVRLEAGLHRISIAYANW
ncbi:MAG: PA14 domain-containing protein [Planctomycetota bacterium]